MLVHVSCMPLAPLLLLKLRVSRIKLLGHLDFLTASIVVTFYYCLSLCYLGAERLLNEFCGTAG